MHSVGTKVDMSGCWVVYVQGLGVNLRFRPTQDPNRKFPATQKKREHDIRKFLNPVVAFYVENKYNQEKQNGKSLEKDAKRVLGTKPFTLLSPY